MSPLAQSLLFGAAFCAVVGALFVTQIVRMRHSHDRLPPLRRRHPDL